MEGLGRTLYPCFEARRLRGGWFGPDDAPTAARLELGVCSGLSQPYKDAETCNVLNIRASKGW
jgi:hypothetical protein